MAMNLKRGLFRAWIVFSLLWTLLMIAFGFIGWKEAVMPKAVCVARTESTMADGKIIKPTSSYYAPSYCIGKGNDVRRQLAVDLKDRKFKSVTLKVVDIDALVEVPQGSNLEEMEAALVKLRNKKKPERAEWDFTLVYALAVASVVPPLMVLLLGLLVLWVVGGFRQSDRSS